MPRPERPFRYVITLNRKPYERLQGGGYRRHMIGKVFETEEEGWLYLRKNWSKIADDRPGVKRFVSATVERLI